MTTTNILSLVGAAIAGGAISFYLTRKFDKKLMQEQEQEFNTVYNDLKNRYYAALSKNSSSNEEVVQSVKQAEEVYENAMKAMRTYEGNQEPIPMQSVSPCDETEFSSDSADSEYPRERIGATIESSAKHLLEREATKLSNSIGINCPGTLFKKMVNQLWT